MKIVKLFSKSYLQEFESSLRFFFLNSLGAQNGPKAFFHRRGLETMRRMFWSKMALF